MPCSTTAIIQILPISANETHDLGSMERNKIKNKQDRTNTLINEFWFITEFVHLNRLDCSPVSKTPPSFRCWLLLCNYVAKPSDIRQNLL